MRRRSGGTCPRTFKNVGSISGFVTPTFRKIKCCNFAFCSCFVVKMQNCLGSFHSLLKNSSICRSNYWDQFSQLNAVVSFLDFSHWSFVFYIEYPSVLSRYWFHLIKGSVSYHCIRSVSFLLLVNSATVLIVILRTYNYIFTLVSLTGRTGSTESTQV